MHLAARLVGCVLLVQSLACAAQRRLLPIRQVLCSGVLSGAQVVSCVSPIPHAVTVMQAC